MGDFRVLVHDMVFHVHVFADDGTWEDDAVFDNGPLLDDAPAPDDGVLHGTLYRATVGNDGHLRVRAFEIMGRAGVVGARVNRPFLVKQSASRLHVNQGKVGVIVTLEVRDGREVATVGDTPDVQFLTLRVDDLWQRVQGGDFLCFLNQLDEEILLHHVGIHEDVLALGGSPVALDGEDPFLFVQIQGVTSQEAFPRVVDGMIYQGDIGLGLDVRLQKLAIVHRVNHVAWRDDDIHLVRTLDVLHVVHVGGDIRVINRIRDVRLGEKHVQVPALGVDVVMAARPDVFHQGTRLLVRVNLDIFNPAVAHVGEREVNHAVSAKEGKRANRTVILQSLHMDVASGKIHDS